VAGPWEHDNEYSGYVKAKVNLTKLVTTRFLISTPLSKLFRCLFNTGLYNKKSWEETIAYGPFTVTLASDTTFRKKTLVCMRSDVNKTTQFVRLQCWYY
jgi:hypothetical protein